MHSGVGDTPDGNLTVTNKNTVRPVGFEPATCGLEVHHDRPTAGESILFLCVSKIVSL
jgi:hypothetical protein